MRLSKVVSREWGFGSGPAKQPANWAFLAGFATFPTVALRLSPRGRKRV